MKSIPIGTAYAVFTGIGAAGTAIIGMIFLSEGVSFWEDRFAYRIINRDYWFEISGRQ